MLRLVALPAALTLLLANGSAAGQTLRGRVVDQATLRGLPNVSLVVLPEDGGPQVGALSDSAGVFLLRLREAGRFEVRVERPGYRGYVTTPLRVEDGEEVALELRMRTDAVVARPVTVVGRRRIDERDAFDARMRYMSRLGAGQFLTRAEMEALRPRTTTDALATLDGMAVTSEGGGARIWMASGGGRCAPALYVDGAPLQGFALDRIVPPQAVRAIEVYRAPAEMPPEFADASGCGVILVWVRPAGGRSIPWRRAVVYVGLIAAGVVLFTR